MGYVTVVRVVSTIPEADGRATADRTRTLLLCFLTATVCFSASCGTDPALRVCTTSADCPGGQICLSGFCVSTSEPGGPIGGDDAAVDDAATDVDATDSASPDAGPFDAGQPRCTSPACNLCEDLHPGVLLCENFDDEPQAPWTRGMGGGGIATIDGTNSFAGGSALRSIVPATGTGYYQYRLPTPIDDGEFHVRVYVYVEPTTMVEEFAVLVDLSDGSSDKLSVDLNRDGELLLIRTDGDALRVGVVGSIPFERWTCVEFQFRATSPGVEGLMALFVDGALVESRSPVVTPAPDGGFSRIRVGVFASPETSANALIDEFVMSTDGRIGCIP